MPDFSLACRKCARLSSFLDEIKKTHSGYHARPVPPFGDEKPALLIVGLAPGMHGANRTGRPFTGDHAGIILYETLYEQGFSNQKTSEMGDGLVLKNCRITNAVKCLPPQNKPEPGEIRQCNGYLASEIAELEEGNALLALGTIAHNAVLSAMSLKAKDYPFSHGAVHQLPGKLRLYDSYHCSRYNTQTKRLTPQMFKAVFAQIKEEISCRMSTSG